MCNSESITWEVMFAETSALEMKPSDGIRNGRSERAILHFPEGFRSGGIGGEKCFEREFGERNVHRRTKNGGSADEGEKARFGDQLERHDYSCIVAICSRGTSRFALAGRGICAKFGHEFHENRVGGDLDLLMQAREQMRAPFGQVGNARRQATGMQAEAKHVDRRAQQGSVCADQKWRHGAI